MIRGMNDEELKSGINELVLEVSQTIWFNPVPNKPQLDASALIRKVISGPDVLAAWKDFELERPEQLLLSWVYFLSVYISLCLCVSAWVFDMYKRTPFCQFAHRYYLTLGETPLNSWNSLSLLQSNFAFDAAVMQFLLKFMYLLKIFPFFLPV